MKVNERIKSLREERGLSQKELAKEIGVSFSSISYWESKKYEPKASYIYKLAIFFNVTADFLLGLEDESGRKIITDEFSYTDGTHTITHKIKK